jgi:hypothetical protein
MKRVHETQSVRRLPALSSTPPPRKRSAKVPTHVTPRSHDVRDDVYRDDARGGGAGSGSHRACKGACGK